MGVLAYTPVDYNYSESFPKAFIILVRQNHFVQGNIFNSAPVYRIAIPMNTNSAFTISLTENPFWYQQFHLRELRTLRGSQPVVGFVVADFG